MTSNASADAARRPPAEGDDAPARTEFQLRFHARPAQPSLLTRQRLTSDAITIAIHFDPVAGLTATQRCGTGGPSVSARAEINA